MTTPNVPAAQRDSFLLRPYTTLELSRLYGVTKKTFRKWLAPFAEAIGERHGYYYTIRQVQVIIDRIGLPSEIPLD